MEERNSMYENIDLEPMKPDDVTADAVIALQKAAKISKK